MMHIYNYVYLSIYLSIYLFICHLSVCLSIYLSFYDVYIALTTPTLWDALGLDVIKFIFSNIATLYSY